MQTPGIVDRRQNAPWLFAWRAALLFCAPMMVNGIGLPYFPVFLEYLKMSPADIGIILSMPHIVRMVGTPLGSFAADRASDRSTVLIWSAVISFATAVVLFFFHSFWPVLIIYSIHSLFYAPYAPIAEAIIITGVRRWGFDYGFLRLWGSVAFVIATLVGGWLFGLFGGAMVLPSMSGLFLLVIVMAIAAPRLGRPDVPVRVGPAAPAATGPMRRPDFLLVLIGAALIQGSHGMLFAFASIYWTAKGFTGTEIGLFWTSGVVAEILMFAIAGRLMGRFSIWALILTGCLVSVGRWLLFPNIDGFAAHLALQATHAFTFGSIHIGVQKFVMQRIEERQESSAQGLYTTFIALFNAVIAWFSGYIYASFGVEGFYLMAVVSLLGIGSVLVARLFQPQSARAGG